MGTEIDAIGLEPEYRTGEDRGPAVVADNAGKSVGTGPTPARILARLGQDPGPAPARFTVISGEGVTLGLLNSGDAIGIDGRWCPVKGCTSINGWVTVDTAFGYPVVMAYTDVQVHLARVIDAEEVTR